MARMRSIIATLVATAAFAIAFREEGHRHSVALAPLKPQGVAGRYDTPVPRDPRDLGRDATSPLEIAPRGWWQVLKRTARKFSDNELMSEAAGVTFYALLSLFPAVTAIVSIYGLFADRGTIEGQIGTISTLMPSGGVEIIREQVHRLTQTPASGLGIGLAFGLGVALWSANAGTKAMLSALNDVYGERESRGFVRVTLTSMAFTLGVMAFLLLAVAVTVVLPKLLAALGLGKASFAVTLAGWPVALACLVGGLAVLYRFGPSRRPARWQWVTWGGMIGALGWIGLSLGFSWYVSHFGNYNKTYGSLGAVIGFMTWIWLSTTVLLVGAQLNAELEAQTGRDSTVGQPRPRGSRGAASADAVS